MKFIFKEDYCGPGYLFMKGVGYLATHQCEKYYELVDSSGNKVVFDPLILPTLANAVSDGGGSDSHTLPKIEVSVWHKDIQIAAKWLYEHHWKGLYNTPDEAEDRIYRSVHSVLEAQKRAIEANPETEATSYLYGSGYCVLFQWEDETWASIRVMIDPLVTKRERKGVHCVTEDIDTLLEYYNAYKVGK